LFRLLSWRRGPSPRDRRPTCPAKGRNHRAAEAGDGIVGTDIIVDRLRQKRKLTAVESQNMRDSIATRARRAYQNPRVRTKANQATDLDFYNTKYYSYV
jgi:hypothetical protein